MKITPLKKDDLGSSIVGSWEAMGVGDRGEAFSESAFPERVVQVTGNFSGFGEAVVEGSVIGGADENWKVLTDAYGGPLKFSSADMLKVGECPRHTRARVTKGDENTSVNVYIFAVKGSR